MKIISINIGTAQKLPGKPSGKSGIFKSPVEGPVLVDAEGLVGDAIVNRKHHGGVDQAIYLEGASDLAWWSSELGYPVVPGLFGENLVIDGVENQSIAVGDRFQCGPVLLEVTSPRIPCSTFAARMEDKLFVKRYTKANRPGAYCRVLAGGMIETGMDVVFTPYAGDRVTMTELMAKYKKVLSPDDQKRFLSAPIHYKLRDMINDQRAK